MNQDLRERDLKTAESIMEVKTSIAYISQQIGGVLENQKKHYERHDEVLDLIKGHTDRLTRLESEKNLLTKILSPVAGFVAGYLGGYFGRHT